jgi:hypothetical protein
MHGSSTLGVRWQCLAALAAARLLTATAVAAACLTQSTPSIFEHSLFVQEKPKGVGEGVVLFLHSKSGATVALLFRNSHYVWLDRNTAAEVKEHITLIAGISNFERCAALCHCHTSCVPSGPVPAGTNFESHATTLQDPVELQA